jgi:hypothetical protein
MSWDSAHTQVTVARKDWEHYDHKEMMNMLNALI